MAQARTKFTILLGLGFSLVVAVALTAGAFVAYAQVKRGFEEQLNRRLKSYAAACAASVSTRQLDEIASEDHELALIYKRRFVALKEEAGIRRAALVKRNGALVVDTEGGKFGTREFSQDANELEACFKQGPVVTIEYSDKEGRVYRNAFAPVRELRTGETVDYAVAVELEADYLERLEAVRWAMVIVVCAVFIVTMGTAMAVSRYESRLLSDLARQRRLAELAQFSAGMAHQIKNPLAAMRGYAELIGRTLEDPTQKKMSDRLIAEISALDRVVRDFLAFSRGAHGSTEKIALKTALAPVAEAAKARGGESVTVNLDCDEGAEVEVDATSLRQALLNLGVNAAEAMRESEVANKKLDIAAHVNGKLVTVDFIDNGPGIPEEVKGKLFEPFVTGKADGTGLGLAISRRLLRDLGGDLLLVRTGPTGTMFRATFAKKSVKD